MPDESKRCGTCGWVWKGMQFDSSSTPPLVCHAPLPQWVITWIDAGHNYDRRMLYDDGTDCTCWKEKDDDA